MAGSPKIHRESLALPASLDASIVASASSSSVVAPSTEPSSPSALPPSISTFSRLALNLQFLASAATSRTSSLAKSDALVPLLLEARAALQLTAELGPASHSQNPAPSPQDLSGINSLFSTTSGAHGASTHAVRFLVAACRCPSSKAVFYLEQALQCNSVVASVELAICLLYGLGAKPDVRRALALLDDGVAAGHPGAMFVVGKCLRDGLGVPADLTAAVAWLKRAADLDYVPALHELGEMYEDGVSPPSASGSSGGGGGGSASESGDVVMEGGRVQLCGLERNLILAMRYYRRAATLGFPPSQLNLAKLFLLSSTVDTTSDENANAVSASLGEYQMKALYWLKKAADLGSQEAKQLLLRTSPPPQEGGAGPQPVAAAAEAEATAPARSSMQGTGVAAVKALRSGATPVAHPAPPPAASAPSSPPRPHLQSQLGIA